MQLWYVALPLKKSLKGEVSRHSWWRLNLSEDPEDIPHILQHIARCSAGAVSLPSPATCGESTKWPTTFCPAQTHCVLCNSKLTCPTHIPGSNGKSYLLTRMGLTCVTALVKRISDDECMARYGYNTWNGDVYLYESMIIVSKIIRWNTSPGDPMVAVLFGY